MAVGEGWGDLMIRHLVYGQWVFMAVGLEADRHTWEIRGTFGDTYKVCGGELLGKLSFATDDHGKRVKTELVMYERSMIYMKSGKDLTDAVHLLLSNWSS
jgi:hypothetical protein